MPLDPDYPAERLAFVLADARPPVLRHAGGAALPAARARGNRRVRRPRTRRARRSQQRQPRPPGAARRTSPTSSTRRARPASRRASRSSIETSRGCSPQPTSGSASAPDDTWLLFHSYAFDFSVWELWGALLYGGRLVVAPFWTTRSPEALAELLVDERVTVLNATPTLFVSAQDELITRRRPSSRSGSWSSAAKRSSLPALRPWFERFGADGPRLVNMYGITETTVHVTYRALAARRLRQRHEPDRASRSPTCSSTCSTAASTPCRRAFRASSSSAAPAWRAAT